MHRFLLKLFTLASIIPFYACSQGQSTEELSAEAFKEMIHQHPDYVVMDVRTPEEYQKGHLLNASNINWNGPDFEHQINALDTSQTILVYCLSGGRSASAASVLRNKGFKVYELKGGILKWRNDGYKEVTAIHSGAGMNKEDFLALLKSDKLILVNFYATWCAPCKKMEPDLLSLEKEMKGNIVVIRMDADEHQELFKDLQLESIPALLLYKNKQLLWSHQGYISKAELMPHLR
jgi:thioredoxin 1